MTSVDVDGFLAALPPDTRAALENLRRVETIASRDLGLSAPAPENTIVVEMPPTPAPAARVAAGPATDTGRPKARN